MSLKQLFYKSTNYSENKVMPKGIFFKFQLVFIFFWRMWKNNRYAIGVCREIIGSLKQKGIKEIAFYGANDVTKILFMLAREAQIEVVGVYDCSLAGKKFLCFNVLAPGKLKGYDGKVIIASFVNVKNKILKLKNIGIQENSILRLQ